MAGNAVSVIVPTYNNAGFIEAAIRSILSQTVPVMEILVIDDGSTDNTKNIVGSIYDGRIRYYRYENSGVSAARNRGLALASGAYIAFLDADDMWRPKMVEAQLLSLNSDIDIVCSFTNFVRFDDETGQKMSEAFNFYPELGDFDGNIIRNAFSTIVRFGEIPAFTQVMMFRRSAIEDLQFNPGLRICEDTAFVLKVFAKGNVAFVRDVLADVRRHKSNSSRGEISALSFHKLSALLSIKENVKQAHRTAYEARVTRAFIDASVDSVAAGDIRAGVRYLSRALVQPGSMVRKCKGLIRVALTAARTGSRLRSQL